MRERKKLERFRAITTAIVQSLSKCYHSALCDNHKYSGSKGMIFYFAFSPTAASGILKAIRHSLMISREKVLKILASLRVLNIAKSRGVNCELLKV